MVPFVDGFSEYNLILIAEEDKLKTSFTTKWGIYYYHVMPFGLNNAGAAYQLMNITLPHDNHFEGGESIHQQHKCEIPEQG